MAEGLSFPWGIAFLSNEEILVTEKTGKLRVIKNGNLLEDSVSGVPDSLFKGQGGLEGIVLHPNFEINNVIRNETVKNGKGYFEDRRPAANINPYQVTSTILQTVMS